jgi:hypothetical protein
MSIKISYGRLFLAFLFSAYFLHFVNTASDWHFIDNVDLIFHEAGHTIFFFLGQFVQVLMGSGFQILLPAFIAGYFLVRKEFFQAAIVLFWVGANFINVSVYAADAVSMQLPLLGGDGVMHDWNYILSTLNILSATPFVAEALYGIGGFCILAATAFSVGLSFNRANDTTP